MTVFETLRCPSCSTQYGLRAHRVKPSHRRARCFQCQSIFGIESEVARLLAAPVPADSEDLAPIQATPAVEEMDLLDFDGPAMEAEAAPVLTAPPVEEAADFDLGVVNFQDFDVEPTLPEASPAEVAPEPELVPETDLSLGDFGSDEDLMEKTLVIDPPTESAPAEDLSADFSSGSYRSAKDAISKLLGDMPSPAASQPERRSLSRSSSGMDVEATLDALDNTLGGSSPAQELEATRPLVAAAALPEAEVPVPHPATDSGSTVRISQQDLMAALTRPEAVPSPAGPRPSAAAPIAPPPPAPVPARPVSDPNPANDQGLLKLQVGSEVYQNLTVEQITAWIDQGRVTESNLVARQFSENWIEAIKVPTLRPSFERQRRQRSLPTELPPPPSPEVPQKRSLFGGLFGRS